MRVLIPTSLRSHTRMARVEADDATLGEVLTDLDRQFPGIRFRRVDGRSLHDLALPLQPGCDVNIVQALSGGWAPLQAPHVND